MVRIGNQEYIGVWRSKDTGKFYKIANDAYIPDWEEVGQSEWDEVSGDWYFEVVYRP